MFFMSQCIVKASFCFAGWVPRLQSDFFSEFSDAISGQKAVTLDLTGAMVCISKIGHEPKFVDGVDTCCSVKLCSKKPFLV